MANVLNVTQPVTGQENLARVRPQAPADNLNPVHQVIDPNKVIKTHDQTVYQDRQQGQYSANMDSNFDKFLNVLRNSQGFTQLYAELFFSKMGNLVNSGIGENFTQEIAKFMELIKMSDAELLQMLKGQQGQNLKFSGPFFDVLRQLVNSNTPNDLKIAVLDFLRKYDSLTSSGHIMNNITANLNNIIASLPKSQGEQFAALVAKLLMVNMQQGQSQGQGAQAGNNPQGQAAANAQNNPQAQMPAGAQNNPQAQMPAGAQNALLAAAVEKLLAAQGQQGQAQTPQAREAVVGNNPQSLEVLKGEIMPFLAKYVTATKDLGPVRNLIAVLTLNIAKYEVGTKESFMQSLRTLASYSEMSAVLKGVSVEELAAQLAKAGQNEGNELVDKLVSIISKGMSGEAGFQNKAVFQNILSSILINESVYMPLLHYTLPANVNGGMFFSELWIDPNAGRVEEGEDGESGGGDGDGRAIKLLIKFDIRDVGFFETIIMAQNKKVDMELYYPDKYAGLENNMKEALTDIMARNNFTFRSLFLAKCEKPKSISEVFPQIYDRRNAINVTA